MVTSFCVTDSTPRHFHNQSELHAANQQSVSRGNYLHVMFKCYMLVWFASFVHQGCAVKNGNCLFPTKWNGKWFQSGVIQPIIIEGDRFSNKGRCVSSDGDKFVIMDEKGCYRCVVMHEKHINVLQYKETISASCHRKENLVGLCSMITGDALLYSMFRENAAPVACPLKGPFSFTYNRGHGDCKSPVSSIESCTEESRLLLNYQACPDVYGTESAVEELECLATWKEGSLRFLVGKVHHSHATSNEDRYRCFVYEKTNGIASAIVKKSDDGIEYRVAQSGDATCNGLFSATEGSRTMALKRVSVNFKCRFPSWMTFSTHWHTLDFSSNYSFHQKNATLRITNQTADVKVHCVAVKASTPSGNTMALVTQWQHHCVTRYVCVLVYRRDSHIAEIQRGSPTIRPDDACSKPYFDAATAVYTTLVASNPESNECPYSGKYDITGLKYNGQRSTRSLIRFKKNARHKYNINHKIRRNVNRNISVNSSSYTIKPLEVNINDLSNNRFLRSRRSPEGISEGSCDINNYSYLEVGCNSPNNMEFHSNCGEDDYVTKYACHGGWYEGGTSYVIVTPLARDSKTARRYCFMLREGDTNHLSFARSTTNCDRSWGYSHASLVFNTSAVGDCQESSSSQSHTVLRWTRLILNLLLPLLFCFR